MKKIITLFLVLFAFSFVWADDACIHPRIVVNAQNITKKILNKDLTKKLEKYTTDFEKMAFVNKVISKIDMKVQVFDMLENGCYEKNYYLLKAIKESFVEYRNQNLYIKYIENNLGLLSGSLPTMTGNWTIQNILWTDGETSLITFINDKYLEILTIKFKFVDNVLYLDIQEDSIKTYLKNNISNYAPVNEILGGKFYTTQILWENTGTALISYEDGHASYQNIFKVISGDNISVIPVIKLGEKFVLGSGKQIKYEDDDLYIKINSFVNSPCPDGAQCFWSGKGINTEFIKNGQTQGGLDLMEAMGYKLELVDSDYTNYATFILSSSIVTGNIITTGSSITTGSDIITGNNILIGVDSLSGSSYTGNISTGTDYVNIAQDKDSDINTLFVRYIRKSIGKKTGDSAVMVSYNILSKELTGNITNYSLWAFCQEYKKSGTEVVSGVIVNTPINIAVAYTGNTYYALSYKVPQSGDNYTGDVQNIFPKTVSDKILNMKQSEYENMINDLLSRAYIAARKFYGL